MPRILLRPRARKDLVEILRYYRDSAGNATVRRFRIAASQTFRDLERNPRIGVTCRVRSAEFRGARMWRIREFTDYLVFYFFDDEAIRIERVIHAARDYRRVLRARRA